jgi:hypothetical protein
VPYEGEPHTPPPTCRVIWDYLQTTENRSGNPSEENV